MTDSFCVYPWINIHSNTDGRCKLCCHIYEENYISENQKPLILGQTDFENVWNGSHMQNVRSQMLKNEKLKECQRCYDHESIGLESSRQWANKTYLKNIENYKKTTAVPPTHLELRLGNVCNLKCVSCWSVSSNSIYKERKSALENNNLPTWLRQQWEHEVKSVESFNWNWFKSDHFKSFIAKSAPHLERLYLTGGEPTLIQENFDVLSEIKRSGNRNVHVAWTSNLMQFPEKFYQTLDFFKSAEVQFSLDGYGSAAEYIRYPSKWTTIENNFQKALLLPKHVQLKIYCVIQAWNILNIAELMRWSLSVANGRQIDFVPIFLEHPDQINCQVWPERLLKKSIEDLSKFEKTPHQESTHRIISYLSRPPKKEQKKLLQQMQEFILINDHMRKQDFSSVFPELALTLKEELT